MRINKHDTNGTKPLLEKGELGYDDYTAGGDVGRVYVGTGTENIALAEKLETNIMSKAQFNALAEERKANRAGSGFDEMGKHYNQISTFQNVNEGMFTLPTQVNGFKLGWRDSSSLGNSKTLYPIANINGIVSPLKYINTTFSENLIIIPTTPTIYPHDTVLTTEQINSGVIKHADASNSGLIVNGKFDIDTSGWTGVRSTIASVLGKLRITLTDVDGGAYQFIPTVIGKKYIIELDTTFGTNTDISIRAYTGTFGTLLANKTTAVQGRHTLEFTATASSTMVYVMTRDSTGKYCDFDNIAVYPADAISRSDLVFLESWHEDVSGKNFVYPLGNVQYLGANTDGLTGIANGAFTGFETYSLFGNWQTPSALIGKGYVWSNLTEAQKRAFTANPENNCYLDGDKVIQVRYRVRVVQGVNDSINPFTKSSNSSYLSLVENGSSSAFLINAKGKRVSIEETKTFASRSTTGTYGYAGGADTILGIVTVAGDLVSNTTFGTPTDVAYEGKCFALPIALVHRKNQGIYHNSYNPNGTKVASDGLDCFSTAVSFTSISDCFDTSKLLAASGYIGSVSGRPDGLFYDQVHESDILDLRNSSKKVEDYNRLISREFNKLVAGTTRGKEGEWEILTKSDITLTYGNYYSGNNINQYLLTPQNLFPTLPLNIHLTGIFILLVKSGTYAGKVIKAERILVDSTYFQISKLPYPVRFTDGSVVPILTGSTVDIVFARQTTRTKSNTLLHCDIIGNPNNYPTAWKESGVFGTPLIVAEDGTSLLPDGVRDTFKLSRKANATPLLCLRSTDNGATWTSFTPTFNTTTNAITLTDEPAGNLVMVYYQTHTSMAVPVANSEVLEIGDVFATSYSSRSPLVSSLIEKVPTYPAGMAGVVPTQILGKPTNYIFNYLSNIEKTDGYRDIPQHKSITLTPVTTPSIKVFPYLTRTNGKAYLNLVFKEMKHNGTSWGDDNKFNIVDNVSTTTDNNAQTVLIGQKTVELPYFIAGDE